MPKRKYLKPEEQEFKTKLVQLWKECYRKHQLNSYALKFPPQSVIMLYHFIYNVHKLPWDAFESEIRNLEVWNRNKSPNLWGLSNESFCNNFIYTFALKYKAKQSIELRKSEAVIDYLIQWLSTWCIQRKSLNQSINLKNAMIHATANGILAYLSDKTIETFKNKAQSYITTHYT